MCESGDSLEAALKAQQEAEAKRRADGSQRDAAIEGKLRKWGADLAAALDAAVAAIRSLDGSSERTVKLDENGAALWYFRRGTEFELTIDARVVCVDTSTPGIKGQLIIVSDPEVDDGFNLAVLDAILQPNDGGEVVDSYHYGLQPLSGIVHVDPVRFVMFLTTLAGRN
jgi:hypothetical protein